MRKTLSVVITIILFSIVVVLLIYFVVVSDFSTKIAVGLSLLVSLLTLGINIISLVKDNASDVNRKLTEVYSPIHAMIVGVNSKFPRERNLQLTVGAFVKASLIDSNKISAVFDQHVDELGDDNLRMWLAIKEEIKEKNGFWLGRDRQKWFDKLEAEYNRLSNRLKLWHRLLFR